LDVGHCLLRARVGEPLREVGRGNVLEPLVNPPQVTLGIANAGLPLAEGRFGWLSQKSSTSFYCTVDSLDVTNASVGSEHPRAGGLVRLNRCF